MKSNYQHIFTPLTVKNMTIKNRIVMMPMGTNYGEQNGEMSFLHINYYKERHWIICRNTYIYKRYHRWRRP